MDPAFTIDDRTGDVHIEGCAFLIGARTTRDDVVRELADRLEPDAKTNAASITWHRLRSLTFGGESASLSMCFGPRGLQSISFGVSLPNPALEDGWPTKQETQREIAFVCRTLRAMWKRSFNGAATFAWGSVWASYDVFSHSSSIGLRYGPAR